MTDYIRIIFYTFSLDIRSIKCSQYSPPVWGDFYAKDGKAGGQDVVTWNTGFTANDSDPAAPAASGSDGNHILRPGSTFTVVPLPSAVWLLGSGLIALVGIRRRISSKKGAQIPAAK